MSTYSGRVVLEGTQATRRALGAQDFHSIHEVEEILRNLDAGALNSRGWITAFRNVIGNT